MTLAAITLALAAGACIALTAWTVYSGICEIKRAIKNPKRSDYG